MRKLLGVVALAALAAAACTSGSKSTTSSGNTAPVASGPAPGVTADSIKLGITYVDLEAIKNLTNINHGDYQAAYRAVIDDINAHGGINGRKIVPVFAPVNPIGTVPAEQACVKLTQDEKVFVAVGFFSADAPMCYVETHETAVIGGAQTAAELARAKAPWFTSEAGEGIQSNAVRAMAEKGLLKGKIAVFANKLDADVMNKTMLPLLDQLKIKPVANAILDAPENDVAAQNQALGVIAERFKSAGADKVLVIGNGGINWANGAEKLSYRPQLLFITLNSISAFYKDAAKRDLSLLAGAVAGDIYGPAQAKFTEQNMAKCLAVQEKAGLKLVPPDQVATGDPAQYVSSFSACANITLFKAIAEKAGKDLNYATFDKAGTLLGKVSIPGFAAPMNYGAGASRDGNSAIYVFKWDPAKNDFVRA